MHASFSFGSHKSTLRATGLALYFFTPVATEITLLASGRSTQMPHYRLCIHDSHLKTPALLMTPSKSFIPTPLPTPLPPLASNNISFIVCSPTSSFNSRATLFRQAIVIFPSSPPILVNNLNASSTSLCWLSSLLLLNLSAATATKCA